MELLNIKAKKCQYVEWPGDTLKMIFDGKDLSSTLLFEGKNAAANQYLCALRVKKYM